MKVCSICLSKHCNEVGIDNTEGCCICYNKSQSEKITLCPECKVKKKLGRKHL